MIELYQIHFFLLICCIMSIEFIIRLNFQSLFFSISSVSKKVFKVIGSDNISENRKEKLVSYYAFLIFKHSLFMLLILLSMIVVFLAPSVIVENFLNFVLSISGVIESIVFSYAYIKIRKVFF